MIQGLVRGWWRWATSKQVSKNGCMLIPSGVGAMWLANNSNRGLIISVFFFKAGLGIIYIYIYCVCIAIRMPLGTTTANSCGRDFGKDPLQNGSNMFKQFIGKSAQFFNIK